MTAVVLFDPRSLVGREASNEFDSILHDETRHGYRLVVKAQGDTIWYSAGKPGHIPLDTLIWSFTNDVEQDMLKIQDMIESGQRCLDSYGDLG